MFENKPYELYKGDCLEIMDTLIKQDIKVDTIITDPPYGTTACKWDNIIPLNEMWDRVKLIRNNNAPTVLFGSEPFSSFMRCSNIDEYKYDWTWKKNIKTNFVHAKRQPLRQSELISIFYKKQCTYNPQKTTGHTPTQKATNCSNGNLYYESKRDYAGGNTDRYPVNIIEFDVCDIKNRFHPTQKPVDLLEYLIKTYTNKGDVILDFTMGSGSTGVAALNTGRKFIGIELDDTYFEIAEKRISESLKNKGL